MTRLFLVRHGETDWNVEGRWQGQADVPLNARGRQQALEVAQRLAEEGLQAIYSSDLQRALHTAQALADLTGLPVRADPRLREIHQGEWQGLLEAEIRARYAERFSQRLQDPLSVAPPGGETVQQVRQRALSALAEIVSRHSQERVAVVAHGFILAVMRTHLEKRPIRQAWDLILPNGAWLEYEL